MHCSVRDYIKHTHRFDWFQHICILIFFPKLCFFNYSKYHQFIVSLLLLLCLLQNIHVYAAVILIHVEEKRPY
jgi:hypothetical protein